MNQYKLTKSIEKNIQKMNIRESLRDRQTSLCHYSEELHQIEETYHKELDKQIKKLETSKNMTGIDSIDKLTSIHELIDAEELDKFFYNLFFFGYADFDEKLGIIICNNNDLFLKVKKFDLGLYTEELYLSRAKANEILNCYEYKFKISTQKGDNKNGNK